MSFRTSYIDTFAPKNLPPRELWPEMTPLMEGGRFYNCAEDLLDCIAHSGFAGKILFYHEDGTWTYERFLKNCNQMAAYLRDVMRLKPGNRVLLRGLNSPLMAATWFAVLKAGGICVTTMPLLRARELSYIVEKTEIEHCLCDVRTFDEIENVQRGGSRLKYVEAFNTPEFLNRINHFDGSFKNHKSYAEDISLIAFTSGTTGKAKATMHTHRDVRAICDLFPKQILKPTSTDVFAGTPPFAFTFGLGGILLFPMSVGASIVLLEKPAPDLLLQAIENFGITTVFTSPTAYKAMLEPFPKFNCGTLNKCVSAGETLPQSVFHAWQDKSGLKLIDGIGATELLHIFISAAGDEIKPGSTGKIVPGYQAAIFDKNGKELPHGELGLLGVRGPTGCRYLADPERQMEYVRNGWNMTGDAYVRDENGYFTYHARADDMIISSGYNISGIEIENVLLSHPKVKECGVVGVSDPERGQIVKAFVVLKNEKDANEETVHLLQDYVKNEIAPYKYPRAIEFVGALPRTETGKLQRFQLRN